ncbi:Protease prsW family protein [uncultured archaeon]|nr:Protease prsW family protein [uncultured archaeon]
MPEKVRKGWNVSSHWNAAFILVLLTCCIFAVLLSLVDLFGFPLISPGGEALATIRDLPQESDFYFTPAGSSAYGWSFDAMRSPLELDVTVKTPPLEYGETVEMVVVSGGKIISDEDCIGEEDVSVGSPVGMTSLACTVPLSYNYAKTDNLTVYAVLTNPGAEESYLAYSLPLEVNWGDYEASFWSSSIVIALAALAGLGLVAVVGAAMAFFALRSKHDAEYAGEYTLESMFNPFRYAKTVSQEIQATIASVPFWALELSGILVVVFYLAVSFEAWKSESAVFAFLASGAFAFITPFLWTALVWFADYKEREPLRLIVSLFLWGGFACLMAIGINTITGSMFIALGIGFLAASFTAPIFEELFKGTGLAIFSLHHEYDGMVDGIVYGFAVGMGFSFVENWLYLLNNPMGGDIGGWITVFTLRSIAFSANHGVFTAMTGGIIGLFKQWRFKYSTLGMLAGMVPAMLLHAIHNSGEIWVALFGGAGALAYFCVLLPLFDYGSLILLAIILIGGVVLTQDKKKEPLEPPDFLKMFGKK